MGFGLKSIYPAYNLDILAILTNLVIHLTQVTSFFWIPGRGRFAPLPGMTDMRHQNSSQQANWISRLTNI